MRLFGERASEPKAGPNALPIGLGAMLEEIVRRYRKREALRFEGTVYTYAEVDEQSNRIAGGLASIGIKRGDRVALMLPNIPEFVFSFFGIQKVGAVAVPFNTMYRGREISFILNDSGAKAIICLANFASLVNEFRDECPSLEHVIISGQRTLVFVDPAATVNVQLVIEQSRVESGDALLRTVGEVLVDTFKALGVADAWYKHQGIVRAHGRKLATIIVSGIENLYIVNVIGFLRAMDAEPLFKVLWVPPEIRSKALEPTTSVEEESGKAPSLAEFRDLLVERFQNAFGVSFEPGDLTRDERIAYEKNRALAGRI